MVAIIAFILPWQTRWLLQTPTIGTSRFEFGVVGIYVSAVAVLIWLCQEIWMARKEIFAWTHALTQEKKYALGALGIFLAAQIIFSHARLLTIQFLLQVFLLIGFALVIYFRPTLKRAAAAGFLLAAVLQALLGAVQVPTDVTFANKIMGIPLRQASTPGVAVVVANGIRHLRAYGGQPHPNVFGMFMLCALLAYFWTLRTAASTQPVWQLAILLCSGLLLSFSRTAWAGFIIFVALAWYARAKLSDRQKQLLLTSAFTMAALGIIFFPFITGRLTANGALEDKSLSERATGIAEWKTVTRNNWIVGTGVGAYTTALTDVEGYNRVPVHDVPLLVFAEFGVIGMALFGFFAWKFWPKKVSLFVLILLPAALFDHYLYSLWAGQVLVIFTLLFTLDVT